MNRRKFIQSSAIATVSALSMPSWLHAMGRKSAVGLQLYTLKDIIDNDIKGTLKQVANFGYTEIETYGYKEGKILSMPSLEFGNYTKDLGMRVVSGHYGMDIIRGNWEQAVADAKAIGQDYMVVPWLNEADRAEENIKKVCLEINKAGEVCKKYGIRMGYHNHDFEFKEVDGKLLYDVMLMELDPKYVGMELDLYWIIYAGIDPFSYFEKYPGRFEQWHVKDMDKKDPKLNTDIGTGSIDFKSLFAKARLSGMKHYYLEQESFVGSPVESIKNGILYLKKL